MASRGPVWDPAAAVIVVIVAYRFEYYLKIYMNAIIIPMGLQQTQCAGRIVTLRVLGVLKNYKEPNQYDLLKVTIGLF